MIESKVSFVALDNPQADELILHILAAFAQYERQAISIRTKDALQADKRRGTILGKDCENLAKENKAKAKGFAQNVKLYILEIQKAGFITVRAIAAALNKRKIFPYYS